MRVFQIKTKLKSPKNKINVITKLCNNKSKILSNNSTKRTRNNNNNSKSKNIFKKIFNINYTKPLCQFPSNDYSLINTTNFTNSKTNNFIFFENSMNNRDNELLKQIRSLIKHNSSNNISNIKFINNHNKIKKEENKRNDSDNLSFNKTHKLSISTNYSMLLNNKNKEKQKEKEKIPKLKYMILNNMPPLTLNFSNDLNSMRKLITNKSTKFFNNYNLNLDMKKKNGEKRAKSSDRKKITANSTNKKMFQNKLLTKKGSFLKNSKSYNNIIYSYFNNISKSTSHTSRKKKESMNNLSKIDIKKISHKRISSKKISDDSKINLQFFQKKQKENNIFIKNKLSPICSKMIDIKSYTRKNSSKERIKFIENKNNNTFFKDNKRIIKRKRVRIFTPEENHFLAVSNIQKIKKYDMEFC